MHDGAEEADSQVKVLGDSSSSCDLLAVGYAGKEGPEMH